MAYSLIAHVGAAGAVSANTGVVDSTNGTFIAVVISYFDSGVAPTVSDSKGNDYSAGGLTIQDSGSIRTQIIHIESPIVGSGHSFSLTGTSLFGVICVQVWSGSGATPFDVENGTPGSASSLAPGSITPSQDNELIVTGIAAGSGGSSFSIDSSFTISDSFDYGPGDHFGTGMAYKVQTTAAAVNPTWSWTSANECAATIASFKAQGGAATVLWAQSVM